MTRRSKQSEIIIEELRKLTTHPRVDEIYALVRQRLPSVSMGTVYRNIGKLAEQGDALEIYCGDFVRYDGRTSPHDHLMCRRCRRVWDFDAGAPAPKGEPNAGDEGFLIDGHYTVFTGLCSDCARQGGRLPT